MIKSPKTFLGQKRLADNGIGAKAIPPSSCCGATAAGHAEALMLSTYREHHTAALHSAGL